MSSGVPTATQCIWEWKRSVFSTNNPGLEDQVSEITLSAVRARIDAWLRANAYWPGDGEDDYSYFIELCHPISDDRRRFFEGMIRIARPYLGYKLLCLLAEANLVRSVWTTNFDGLVARAAADFDLTPIEVGIECSQRLFRQPAMKELVCVSLHGDYRYDALKNTAEELRIQEAQLEASLIATLRDHSLIVSGYSGRDASVMTALTKAICDTEATGKIYWCDFGDEPTAPVAKLLVTAKETGRDAYFVPNVAFDDLMTRIALHGTEGDQLARAQRIVGSPADAEFPVRAAFQPIQDEPSELIKSNAWPIRCPAEAFQFDLKEWPTEKVWQWLRDKADGFNVVAVPLRKVLAFGTLGDIKNVFADDIAGNIERVPLTNDDMRYEDGAVISLARTALIRSLAESFSLESDGKRMLWETSSNDRQQDSGKWFPVHRAIAVSLRLIDNQLYLALDPTFHVSGDLDTERDSMVRIRKNLLGYQHNADFNTDLNYWRKLLFTGEGSTEFDYPVGTGAFRFVIDNMPAFAGLTRSGRRAPPLAEDYLKLVHHTGIVVEEPKLSFATAGGWKPASDTMPLRGLATHGPFDTTLSDSAVDNTIRLSVICPRAESPMLESFLAEGNRKLSPQRGQREEYMVDYPGFAAAYRVPLLTPARDDVAWHLLPELDATLDARAGSLELSRQIRDAVDAVAASGSSVVLILTPTRWSSWRGFKTDSESFDVHDFVKAHSAQRGIATQFLDQDTLGYPDKCRVWWWLSVALYAKAMRTPWVLEGLDPETAFVGLGYTIRRHASPGEHVVLGCSHIYNAQGQGLQFRLSKIENPIISRGNPFLPYEDARRVGETIRELFWRSRVELPKRVVLHKQTPFRRDEQKGLRAGLEGVGELDLIEINEESALRYVSSEMKKNGPTQAMFPVRRGTTVRLSDNEALVWVHGATDAVKTNWTYFQGKRRIPGPLVIRRYAGRSDLALVASEVLGLSKMDWNSGDLYSQKPATLESSKHIARIAALLQRLRTESYDYRLFM